ncbi:MAG: sensor histidine kinase, partial [Janthinobacterium lividum]
DTNLKLIQRQRKIKLQNLKNKILNFSFSNFFGDNGLNNEAVYAYFGLFCIISAFSTIHTLPREILLSHHKIINFIYPSILLIATALISYPLWLDNWKTSRLIAVFYNIAAFYILICLGFLFVVLSNFAHIQSITLMINLIIVAVSLRWQLALFLMVIGLFTTIQFYKFYTSFCHLEYNVISTNFETVYLILSISSIFIVFIKPKQEHQELTEQKANHLSRRVNTQEEQVYKALSIKDEFIRNVQHEYHTPMTGVVSLAEALLASYKNMPLERIGGYLEDIYKSAVRIDSYDNNINMLSQFSKASYELHLEQIDLSNLLYERVEICRKLYEQNKEDREFIFDIQESVTVNIDRKYFIKLLDNLIINAISYCKRGKIAITLKRNDKNISMLVADEGIGIPAADIHHIFGSFTVSSKTWTPAGGRGIGLALCRCVIEVHGGIIKAESNGIKGATFELSMPAS